MAKVRTFTPQEPPRAPKMSFTTWASPTMRSLDKAKLKQRVGPKQVIRALIPPVIYLAAHRLKRALAPTALSESLVAASASQHPEASESKTPDFVFRHALALRDRVPELQSFQLNITQANAAAALRFYSACLPLFRPESHGAYLRTILARLRHESPDLSNEVSVAIAKSDLADGMPERAQLLSEDPGSAGELERQSQALNEAYGAELIGPDWSTVSRGATLLYYFRSHPQLVQGKRVLHVAPEPELRSYLAQVCTYSTLDGMPDVVPDFLADVTALPQPDQSSDVVICHRVLEHVFEDRLAMREFFRILRPGGLLNLSVPQATHREHATEWLVQDESHHSHVRQYGRDLEGRLAEAGFRVEIVTWLTEQSVERLQDCSAYPMRMYNAWVPR